MSVRVEKPRVTTTDSFKNGPLRCMVCGRKAAVLTQNAQGKPACADCVGARFPLIREVTDGPASAAD